VAMATRPQDGLNGSGKEQWRQRAALFDSSGSARAKFGMPHDGFVGNPKPEAALLDIRETVRHIAGGGGEELHVVRWYAVMRILEELTVSASKLAATAWEMATEQGEDHSYTKSAGLGFRCGPHRVRGAIPYGNSLLWQCPAAQATGEGIRPGDRRAEHGIRGVHAEHSPQGSEHSDSVSTCRGS
jgi:hypothetical protein